jgi:AcrR family transcriptional regulator
MKPIDLPVVGAPSERADAARNRQRIIVAAERLFARDGVACTSMDAIAAEAHVGKGTLFRRFGDRASLALALLDSSERDFQEAFIRGPAPLGPGAPARERLIAFGRSLLAHLAAHGELILVAQTAGTPGRRFDGGPHGAYRAHVTALLREAAPDLDAEYAAEAVLAPLGAEIVLHQLLRSDMTLDRLAAGWEAIVRRLVRDDGSAVKLRTNTPSN